VHIEENGNLQQVFRTDALAPKEHDYKFRYVYGFNKKFRGGLERPSRIKKF
jgi:hypothetical protein